MTVEEIFETVIVFICMMPIIIIGIIQYRSKKPVGFWSGKEPPKKEQITDVEAYNHKHGIMWIFYGAGFILCFICGFIFSEKIALILSSTECIGGIFVMIAYHNKLNHMYYKKEGEE